MKLGALRNVSIRESHGDYIAQWDDDDWFSPLRLECQYETLIKSGKPACLLSRWTVYDAKTGRSYISNPRAWEGSLLCRKTAMVAYPELPMGEDTPAIQQLLDACQVTLLERPELYIYAYHGRNVWDRRHWEDIFHCSTPLDPDLNRTVKGLMTLPGRRLGWIRNLLDRWGG
jgi:glycosyltransferase involved in cell wall biosynthesis